MDTCKKCLEYVFAPGTRPPFLWECNSFEGMSLCRFAFPQNIESLKVLNDSLLCPRLLTQLENFPINALGCFSIICAVLNDMKSYTQRTTLIQSDYQFNWLTNKIHVFIWNYCCSLSPFQLLSKEMIWNSKYAKFIVVGHNKKYNFRMFGNLQGHIDCHCLKPLLLVYLINSWWEHVWEDDMW